MHLGRSRQESEPEGVSNREKGRKSKRAVNLNRVVREGDMEKVALEPKLKEAMERTVQVPGRSMPAEQPGGWSGTDRFGDSMEVSGVGCTGGVGGEGAGKWQGTDCGVPCRPSRCPWVSL